MTRPRTFLARVEVHDGGQVVRVLALVAPRAEALGEVEANLAGALLRVPVAGAAAHAAAAHAAHHGVLTHGQRALRRRQGAEAGAVHRCSWRADGALRGGGCGRRGGRASSPVACAEPPLARRRRVGRITCACRREAQRRRARSTRRVAAGVRQSRARTRAPRRFASSAGSVRGRDCAVPATARCPTPRPHDELGAAGRWCALPDS